MNRPNILKAAAIGGAASAVAGAIPIVACLNVLCCALVVGGGFLADYINMSDHKKAGLAYGAGDGAKVGALAGVFNGVISGVLSVIVRLACGTPDMSEIFGPMQEQGMEIPPAAMEMAESFASGCVMAILFGLVIGVIFSAIGGLIGGSVLKVEAAATEETFT